MKIANQCAHFLRHPMLPTVPTRMPDDWFAKSLHHERSRGGEFMNICQFLTSVVSSTDS